MDLIEQAFQKIDRKFFVPDSQLDFVGFDTPLPIGYGQTISQPTTVRLMLTWLDAQPKQSVLDIGSGSGWTSALLSEIVGPKGTVYAVEVVPELIEFGMSNCAKLHLNNIKFFQAGSDYGLEEFSPYDRILVSASAQKLPIEILHQLKIGGKLVIPVKNDILEITKLSKNKYDTKVHSGFVFVPLI